MKITIIGAGNGGHAMAAHFTLLGHQVILYNRSEEKIKELLQTKTINVTDAINTNAILYDVTTDLRYAIDFAEVIMITTTANAHRELAENMAEYVRENQIIVLNPGRTLGAIEFSNAISKLTSKRLYIAEAQSLIYACRIEGPCTVRIIGIKDKVYLAAYPAKNTDYVLSILNTIYNCFIRTESILNTGLENIGAIFHPTVILFNAASIERGNMFYFYNDMTPGVAMFLEKIDKERLEIGRAFGIDLLSVSEWVSFAYKGITGTTLCDKMRNNPAYHKILAPTTLHSRLLLEDVPTGVLPMVELGEVVGVKTPLLRSVLNITQELLDIDFNIKGRTLKNLGLDGIGKVELLNKM